VFLDGGVTIQFIWLPAGRFLSGSSADEPGRFSDETQHPVKLTRGFYMQTTEVTQAQWQALMGNNPSSFTGDATRPVERVSWWDAVAYANALSAKEGLSPAYSLTGCSGTPGSGNYSCSGISLNSSDGTPYGTTGYRLPTESEWEYAYRAGTSTAFYNGAISSSHGSDAKLDLIGWYDRNSGNTTHPVGQKQANGWGLYDMAGNVWEWCWDWYGDYPVGSVTDPAGSTTGSYRVCRGGSWFIDALSARAANRSNADPGYRGGNLGFRLSRSSP